MAETPREQWSHLPTEKRPSKGVGEVLIEHTVVNDLGCWEWTGSTQVGGYGQSWRNGRTVLAHRMAYEATHGQIEVGLQLDHLCRNRRCVRPDHLEPVTPRDNTMRSRSFAASNALKTKCPAGHSYDATNTGLNNGKRYCKPCQAAHARRYRRNRAGAPQ